jgi:5-methylcytosine-specific restriction endonuclease McrA
LPTKGQINPAIRGQDGKIIPWKKRNKVQANATERLRRANNPEMVRRQNKAYRENNPFAVAVIVARRRAKELGVDSTLTREEWEYVVKQTGFICHVCGDVVSLEIGSQETLSLDHIVPMSRGGANVKENVAPAHRRCNQSRLNMMLAEFYDLVDKIRKYRNG